MRPDFSRRLFFCFGSFLFFCVGAHPQTCSSSTLPNRWQVSPTSTANPSSSLVGHWSAMGRRSKKNGIQTIYFSIFFGKKKKNPPSTRDSMKETPEPTHLYRETHWGGHEKRRKRKNRYVPGRSKNTSFFFVRKRGKRNNPEPEPNDDEEEFQKRKKKETAATDLQRPIDAPGRLFSVPKRGRSFLFFLYFFFGTLPVPSNLMPFRP